MATFPSTTTKSPEWKSLDTYKYISQVSHSLIGAGKIFTMQLKYTIIYNLVQLKCGKTKRRFSFGLSVFPNLPQVAWMNYIIKMFNTSIRQLSIERVL